MEQKKRVDENQKKKTDEVSVSPFYFILFYLSFYKSFCMF